MLCIQYIGKRITAEYRNVSLPSRTGNSFPCSFPEMILSSRKITGFCSSLIQYGGQSDPVLVVPHGNRKLGWPLSGRMPIKLPSDVPLYCVVSHYKKGCIDYKHLYYRANAPPALM